MKLRIDTFKYFLFCGLLYFLAVPLEVTIFDKDLPVIVEYLVGDGDFLLLVSFVAIQAFAGFYIGYSLTGFRRTEQQVAKKGLSSNIQQLEKTEFLFRVTAYFMLVWGLLFYSGNFAANAFNYYANYTNTYTDSGFAVYKQITYPLLAFVCLMNWKLQKNSRRTFLLGILIFAGIVTFDKDPLVIAIFVAFVGSGWINTPISLSKIVGVSIVVYFTLVVLKAFSFIRGGLGLGAALLRAWREFSLSALDGAGPYLSISHSLSDEPHWWFGWSYIAEFMNLVPRFLYPDRPPTIPEAFARSISPYWMPGIGFGYSPLAEGYHNFGLYGVWLHFIVIGVMWGLWWKYLFKLSRYLFRFDLATFMYLYYSFGFYLLLLIFRGTGLSFVKVSLIVLVPVFALTYFHLLIRPRK